MKKTERLYRILEIINRKAARRKLKNQICENLDIHLQTFYRKIKTSPDSRIPHRFNEEEEKIIADTLGVEVSELFAINKETEHREKSTHRLHTDTVSA